MALGSTLQFDTGPTDTRPFRVSSVVSFWSVVIDAGGMTVQDASPITNPDLEITASTRHIISGDNEQSVFLALRMAYDDGLASITDPIVKVFGRASDAQDWEILRNKAGSITGTIATDTTNDVSDGTLNWTTTHADNNVWDRNGCNEFLVGVETALAGFGDTSNAYLEMRAI